MFNHKDIMHVDTEVSFLSTVFHYIKSPIRMCVTDIFYGKSF
jgi:hypothetical protein